MPLAGCAAALAKDVLRGWKWAAGPTDCAAVGVVLGLALVLPLDLWRSMEERPQTALEAAGALAPLELVQAELEGAAFGSQYTMLASLGVSCRKGVP